MTDTRFGTDSPEHQDMVRALRALLHDLFAGLVAGSDNPEIISLASGTLYYFLRDEGVGVLVELLAEWESKGEKLMNGRKLH